MSWRVGQEIMCVRRCGWFLISGSDKNKNSHPLFGKVYTILSFVTDDGGTWLKLVEFPENEYWDVYFIPLTTASQDAEVREALRIKEFINHPL